MRKIYLIITCTILLSFLWGCDRQKTSEQTAKTITGAGANYIYLFFEVLSSDLQSQINTSIVYNATNSTSSVNAFRNKAVDFLCLPVVPNKDMFPSETVPIPISTVALVVSFNIPGIDELRLNASLITKIYTGQIKKWNDPAITALNPKLKQKDIPIIPIYRSDNSGMTYIFSGYMNDVSPDWNKRLGKGSTLQFEHGIGVIGNECMVSSVNSIEGAIGYSMIEHADLLNLSIASIMNSHRNYVKPDAHSMSRAIPSSIKEDIYTSFINSPEEGAYPITLFTWLIVYKNQQYDKRSPDKQQRLVSFLRYITNEDTQKKASVIGYLPLPEPVIEKVEKLIDTIEYDTNQSDRR